MTSKEAKFVNTVWEYFHKQGRHTLPWRQTTDPYLIAVSEIMLQQTQVDRVIPKYAVFVKKWPTVKALACTSLADVLILWQGLGYNRRAKSLHRCAQVVESEYGGIFPVDYHTLTKLPGIGPYTAGAISAFAYNKAVPMLETNIKTAYIHHFFKEQTMISDTDLRALVARTLDIEKPRLWYYALMDYGAHLKKTGYNNIAQTKTYKTQSTFKNSDRQLRGAIVRTLVANSCTRRKLHQILAMFTVTRIDAALTTLEAEGMIKKQGASYTLPI